MSDGRYHDCWFDLPPAIPFTFSLHTLAARLALLVDQRDPRGMRYPLTHRMVAILAKLAGYQLVEALRDRARLRAADLVPVFGLARLTMPHGRTWEPHLRPGRHPAVAPRAAQPDSPL